jgi:hypothetical protein
MPTPRHFLAAGVANGLVYAIDGVCTNPYRHCNGTLNIIEAFTP